jgi:hypothetical protein
MGCGRVIGRFFYHFHLRELEEFRFAYDEKVISMSISRAHGNEIRHSAAVGSDDSIHKETIGAGSPYWMDVEINNSKGPAGIIPL